MTEIGTRKMPNGEVHGHINRVANSVKEEDAYKNFKPQDKAELDKRRKEDAKIVRAQYLNDRGDNERCTKPYCRYAGDPIDTYHLIPNEEYELPYGFIKEVNGSPGLPQRSGVLDAKGNATAVDGKNVKIHRLVPVGF